VPTVESRLLVTIFPLYRTSVAEGLWAGLYTREETVDVTKSDATHHESGCSRRRAGCKPLQNWALMFELRYVGQLTVREFGHILPKNSAP